MYKVEFIHKKSTYDDIIENWKGLGKSNDSEHGFIFESYNCPYFHDGVLELNKDGKTYVYNPSDFYRIKYEYKPE